MTGRIASSQPNLQSLTRHEAEEALERFLLQNPGFEVHLAQEVGSGINPHWLSVDYAKTERGLVDSLRAKERSTQQVLVPVIDEGRFEEILAEDSSIYSSTLSKVMNLCANRVDEYCRPLLKMNCAQSV